MFLKLTIAVFLGMTSISVAYGLDADLVNKQNCGIIKPPVESGVDIVHGKYFFVFPMHTFINNNYTGCQTMWLEDNSLKIILYIENGKMKEALFVASNVTKKCNYANNESIDIKEDCVFGDIDEPAILSFPLSKYPKAREKLDSLINLLKDN
jgi:hypothetical protein